ncbi:Molybdopterin biosynthesis MoaE [Desarmillaria tabescens]|uniref:Molybdopterin synthase catalytic subunit n=1 Tax=Armillaria tabescens TaxID=1929756 RepID=A0AA39JRA6_ARMTA|nr:Molybdopterin biosynthesis MoaE [Desarmillaria tabescens]KAK0446411.1 Molybdopterin biosynthesis MoaE [Desarmillaria tabescens]
MTTPKASIDIALDVPGGVCSITSQPLDVQQIVKSVGDDGAGATAVFIGTTRNSFKGRTVTRLEYQAYSKLAIKTMASISSRRHQPESHSSLIRCAVHHRIGVVPVGEPSIVIAVSSPHRKEAFVACERILEEVKQKAQIWKREYYEGMDDSEAEWKANA